MGYGYSSRVSTRQVLLSTPILRTIYTMISVIHQMMSVYRGRAGLDITCSMSLKEGLRGKGILPRMKPEKK